MSLTRIFTFKSDINFIFIINRLNTCEFNMYSKNDSVIHFNEVDSHSDISEKQNSSSDIEDSEPSFVITHIID